MIEKREHLGSEMLQAFLEGELSDTVRVEAEAHLESCARCSAELEGWNLLFAELGELPEVTPSPAFADRVMARILSEAPLLLSPWQRLRTRFEGLRRGGDEHLGPERIQDFLDGLVRGRAARSIGSHLEGCAACKSEVEVWGGVFQSLRSLPRLAPSEGFVERVLAAIPAGAPATSSVLLFPTPAGAPSRIGTLAAAARGLLPKTRRGWALGGAALAAPALGFLVLVGSVVLHPLLSFGDLALYATWQGLALVQDVITWAGGVVVQSPFLYQLYGFAGSLFASPVLAGGGLIALWALTLASAWVLYRHVIAPSFLGNRHVQAS